MRRRAIADSRITWVAASRSDRQQRAETDLDHDVRHEEPRLDHEVERAEGLVGLVDPVDQVEHLEREVDEEGEEQVLRDRVEAQHVDRHPPQPAQGHVEQHDGGDARDDRREEEDDRHQRRRPPRIGLDRPEDEADVAVQQERRRDADDRDEAADPVVDPERLAG